MTKYIAVLPKAGNFRKDKMVARAAAGGIIEADVVELEAEALGHVFALLNHGSGCELPGYTGRSLSVGDVVMEVGGKMWMCDSIGWTELP